MGYGDESKQEAYREVDRFSRLMFGERKYRDTYKQEDNESQELSEEQESSSFQRRTKQRKDDWFWGTRRKAPAARKQTKIESILENVDIGQLMETVDMIVATTKQYKPIIKEIRPFIDGFIKKFKSSK
jgi:hypothetical protein